MRTEQVQPPANATNTTAPTGGENVTDGPGGVPPTNNSTTADGGSDGGGGWLEDQVPSVPEMGAELLGWLRQLVADIIAGVINEFHFAMLQVPAPGELGDPMTWVMPPEGTYWHVAYVAYYALSGVSLFAIANNGVFGWTVRDVATRRQRLRRCARAIVLTICGVILLPAYLHLGHTLAMGIAPTGEYFLSSYTDMARFGLGALGSLILVVLFGRLAIKGIFYQVAMWLGVFFFFALWPVAVALESSEKLALRTIGLAGMSALIAIPPIKVLQATLLWFMSQLPISITEPATLSTLVIVFVGVHMALLTVPTKAGKSVLPNTVVAAGGSFDAVGGEVGGRLKERAPSRGEVTKQIKEIRGSDDATAHRGPTETPQKSPQTRAKIKGGSGNPGDAPPPGSSGFDTNKRYTGPGGQSFTHESNIHSARPPPEGKPDGGSGSDSPRKTTNHMVDAQKRRSSGTGPTADEIRNRARDRKHRGPDGDR